MQLRSYFAIGSDPLNDLQLEAEGIFPFHVLLYADASGRVFVSARAPGARYTLDEVVYNDLRLLDARKQLAIAGQHIDWQAIFDIDLQELSIVEQQQDQVVASEKRLDLQLILIYVSVALLLLLMAFYI